MSKWGQGRRLARRAIGNLWAATDRAGPPVARLVERLEGRLLLSVGSTVVTNTNDAGTGSLRQAILNANADAATDTISFNIAGSGVHTIAPASALPAITQPCNIFANSQPGYNDLPLIEINGANAGLGVFGRGISGLVITAGQSVLIGLAINRFSGNGLVLQNGGGNIVFRCFLGTNAAGTADLGNGRSGLVIDNSPGNSIGTNASNTSNVISGNGADGVVIDGAAATGNTIAGNFIGTNVSGTGAIANAQGGVLIESPNNTVGGAGQRNVISGNTGDGVALASGSGSTTVTANLIGTNAAGTGAIANSGAGVKIDASSNNTIGGAAANLSNTIADNGGAGIAVVNASTGNAIFGNSIFANSGLGIDLNNDGVTANDASDADTGPNNFQNFPILNAAFSSATTTTIGGMLSSVPNKTYRIEFFSNTSADPSGNGEGQTYLGATTVTTGFNGPADFGATFATSVPVGRLITATATDASNNTSEFSATFIVSAAANAFTVTNINDSGPGSLRQAIFNANADPDTSTIRFAIGSGPKTILIKQPLPTIDNPVSILGNTQPGWVDKPIIAVDAPGVGGTGLKITGGQSVILDLCLEAFGNAIEIDNKGGNVIGGCYLGTDLSGLAAASNDTGILIFYSTGNAIGGAAAAFHNVISGNIYAGVVVAGIADGNDISGNYIGVGADGATPVGNGYGVVLDCSGATVGSPVAGGGNVISGNKSSGIYIDDGNGDFGTVFVFKNLIRGNLIGTDATGTKAVGNGGDGISVENTTDDTIGGAAAGEGNVIAANKFYGIAFGSASGSIKNELIAGNRIGLPAGNGSGGILLNGANASTIGGTAAGDRNVISGNGGPGIRILEPVTHLPDGSTLVGRTDDNQVLGNYIGTDVGGAVARPNTGAGIEANFHNFIGGEAAGAGNLISGNDGPGILVPPGEQVTIQGNRIGTIASGLIPLPNQGDGILEQGSALIGGTSDGARNIISGNAGAGIHVKPGSSPIPHSPSVATVRGNYIGLAATGAFAVPNAGFGVFLDTASFGQIGGSTIGAGNVISGNQDDGIRITAGNLSTVRGNLIGVNPLGSAAIPNAGNGISLVSTGTATIGGTAAPDRNIIAGNTGNGIVIDANTKQVTIQGNWIGPASAAGGVLPNLGGDGIRILNNADTVGGTAAGAGNLIAGHANAGIHLTSASAADTGASSNVVQGNTIGLDAMGKPAGNKWGVLIDAGGADQIGGTTTGAGNVITSNGTSVRVLVPNHDTIRGNSIFSNTAAFAGTTGLGIDLLDPGVNPNVASGVTASLNYPVLASTLGPGNTIAGTLHARPNQSYAIEIFASPAPNPSGFGEGQMLVGTGTAATDAAGDASFTIVVADTFAVGEYLTATSTDSDGNTSEFSKAVQPAKAGAGISAVLTAESPDNDLTALGTRDWVHYGISAATDVDRKATPTERIGDLTQINGGNLAQYGDNPSTFSWADGQPHAAVNRTATGDFVSGPIGAGFELVVPADATPRVLKLFVGAFMAGGKISARLSDSSAPLFADTGVVNPNGKTAGVYTIVYSSATGTTGQSLIVDWTLASAPAGSASNITIQAVTLLGGSDFPAPSQLVAGGCMPGALTLRWHDNSDTESGFGIEQSTDGGATFTQFVTAPANATSYPVAGLDPTATYQFRVRALGASASGYSNIVTPSAAGSPLTVTHSNGFAGATDLVLNGTARITADAEIPANALELTASENFQVASAFTAVEHAIDSFDTSFDFQFGAMPAADGFTFTLQGSDPREIGVAGSGLGYEDIHHSVAFTYDLFPAHSRVGFFVDGDPAVENDAFSLDVTGSGIDFHGTPTTASDVFRVHIVFNGIAAQETITDLNTNAAFTKTYSVDIPALVGSSCAYLGFTGATGAAHAQQDILNWTFASAPPAAPAAPGNLTATAVSATEIDLAWNDNSSNENAFKIERKIAGGTYAQLATVPANATSYKDTTVQPVAQYLYRVRATNSGGDSDYSNEAGAATPAGSVPPRVSASNYIYDRLPHALTFTFTKDVSSGLTPDAVKVRNLATGADVSVSDVGYDAATNIATFRFAGQLPEGNYRATLVSSAIKDTDGNHLDGNGDGAAGDDYSFDFFFQPGDVNHDGKVNFGDLLILAQHYGSTATFAEGDLNYDHSVGFADLLILAQNYGRTLTSASTTALPGQTPQWRRYRIPGVVTGIARRS